MYNKHKKRSRKTYKKGLQNFKTFMTARPDKNNAVFGRWGWLFK